MTHSVYVRDPDGHSVEVLYDLPADVWAGDVNGPQLLRAAAVRGPEALVDDTDYERFEAAAEPTTLRTRLDPSDPGVLSVGQGGDVASAFGLGETAPLDGPVARGEQGQVWRLTTPEGTGP